MKKNVAGLVLIGVMLVLAGCGKKEVQPSENSTEVQEEAEVREETEEQESSQSGNVLCGVYPDAEEVVDIPMGTFYDGKQEVMCNIKMPVNYLIGAGYTEDGINGHILEEASGGIELKTALDIGLKEQEYAIFDVNLDSYDGTKLNFNIISVEKGSMEDMKEYAASYQEIGTADHPAINFEDPDEFSSADVNVYYTVNENFMLWISYEGPLADEIGKEQLAQNLYDLVEVIE